METNAAIATAGEAISAGSLLSYSNPAEFRLWNGLLYLEAEEYDAAAALFEESRQEAKKAADTEAEQAALNNLALVYMRRKNFARADQILAEAISVHDQPAVELFTNRVICLMELNRETEAAVVVEDAVSRFPGLQTSDIIQRYRSGSPRDAA